MSSNDVDEFIEEVADHNTELAQFFREVKYENEKRDNGLDEIAERVFFEMNDPEREETLNISPFLIEAIRFGLIWGEEDE